MTKRQVRSRMRHMREQFEEAEEDTGEINLVPYMDIVTNIIIFLLASVINQVPLGTVNVRRPPSAVGRRRQRTGKTGAQPHRDGRQLGLYARWFGRCHAAHP